MAKSEVEIQSEIIESIATSDITIDTAQGPIPDLFIRPQAGQLALASSEAESLRTLFTLNFPEAATEDEIKNALANYGSSPGDGESAQHIQYFMRFTRPSSDVVIPAGSLVANADGSLTYRVVNSGTLSAGSADSYFNSSRNSYEMGLLVRATGIGLEYNLPAGRITSISTPILGIDATENRSKSSGGLDVESVTNQSERLKNSLKGIDLGAPGGISSRILNTFPEIVTDVAVVQPFEKEFTRQVLGPSLDVYVIGSEITLATQSINAVNGQTVIVLENQPVISISSVTVNNLVLSSGYDFVQDTTFEFGYSLRSQDQVVFSVPLVAGDVVVITYEYNSILSKVNTEVLDSGNDFLFNTDILVRYPFIVPPVISGIVQSLASFSTSEVEDNVNNFISSVFTFTTFTEIVFPEVFRQRLISEVSGVQNFKMTEFRRSTGSLSTIEPITFSRSEISTYDADLIDIRISK
jgi:hypothetical protein